MDLEKLSSKPKRRPVIEPVEPVGADYVPKDDIPGKPVPGQKGASQEWMREMTRRRMALYAKDPEKRKASYKPRTKFTKAEAEADALRRLMPRALAVLEEQLESPDERVRQSAAIKVMEYVKGKPTQTINQQTDQVTRIVYESAAWMPDIEGELSKGAPAFEPLELPPAEEPDTM